MNNFSIYFEEEIPKYIQIERHIKKLIDENKIKDGEKLPSIRKLSEILDVNNDTIINAYEKLESEGYARKKIGSGTYAKRREGTKNFKKIYTDILKKISAEELKTYVDFTGDATCSDFFPIKCFKNVLNEVLDRDGAEALIYQDPLGYYGLRKSISKFFWNDQLDSDNVLIVSGAQQGIDIVSKSILNVNDNVAVEKPTYNGALSVFKWRRANVFEIPIKSDGIDVDYFEKILMKNTIKCFYTMSYFQNPTGISCSLEKKLRILKLAEIYDFYIIEDDYLSELIYDKNIKYNSFKSLDKNDRVIYIKSFSKIFLPGIRIGYMIPPEIFRESIQNSKISTDISTSSLMQRALDLYINKGFWKEYIDNLSEMYYKRYVYIIHCIENNLLPMVEYIKPGGGLSIYLKISENVNLDSAKLFFECKRKNVLITPGVLFYKNSFDGSKFFKLGFSQIDEAKIKQGINILKLILQKYYKS